MHSEMEGDGFVQHAHGLSDEINRVTRGCTIRGDSRCRKHFTRGCNRVTGGCIIAHQSDSLMKGTTSLKQVEADTREGTVRLERTPISNSGKGDFSHSRPKGSRNKKDKQSPTLLEQVTDDEEVTTRVKRVRLEGKKFSLHPRGSKELMFRCLKLEMKQTHLKLI